MGFSAPTPDIYDGPVPDPYQAALRERGVPQHRIVFYWKWVGRWARRPREPEPGRSPASAFASSLARQGVEDWQCRQAFQAIQIWSELHPPHPLLSPGPSDSSGTPDPFARQHWPTVLHFLQIRLRTSNYSPRTIEAYHDWVRRFAELVPQVPQDSQELSSAMDQFLGVLATGRNLSPASVSLARNALAWLAKNVLFLPFQLAPRGSAHVGKRLPHVVSPSQIERLLEHAGPAWQLPFALQYGCGLRLAELLDLRTQDLELDRGLLLVRRGKGDKDRRLPLPKALQSRLASHLVQRRRLYETDLQAGFAMVELPHALERKVPGLATSWEWQHLFPSPRPLRHPTQDRRVRWHPLEGTVRAALRRAAEAAGIAGRVHPHLLRHCYATHLLESGMSLREIQELLGHARLETTMVYLHVRAAPAQQRSPLDSLSLSARWQEAALQQ